MVSTHSHLGAAQIKNPHDSLLTVQRWTFWCEVKCYCFYYTVAPSLFEQCFKVWGEIRSHNCVWLTLRTGNGFGIIYSVFRILYRGDFKTGSRWRQFVIKIPLSSQSPTQQLPAHSRIPAHICGRLFVNVIMRGSFVPFNTIRFNHCGKSTVSHSEGPIWSPWKTLGSGEWSKAKFQYICVIYTHTCRIYLQVSQNSRTKTQNPRLCSNCQPMFFPQGRQPGEEQTLSTMVCGVYASMRT